MFTFVLSQDKKPLLPCHPARARKLLSQGFLILSNYLFERECQDLSGIY
jgi:hypothetical protein